MRLLFAAKTQILFSKGAQWRANLPFIRDFDFLHLKIPFPWHVKDQELSNIIWLAA
ncbi:hypothetical protein BCR37DRAFT_383334 [Protomyces lactucae-debilis]|uniref:Uncharacterized protein n=1 Tax=Protomyces lactucae-debilis TaxID=2754530 RepID=A0A1Y2EYG0_PROLT|nr:uncharacterized protein BCR37DRAFT_383319 [Protomyces lactucae-debilis]XP_040722760.1 uncharacterized protein BCR37DRAFT_383334 [Protomyces lactucae-debilis]ORY76671.1 hypothetical protein BCR37DRAFT_383319 [Protomyces lactucae-debilis]ORY76680.1 hypothetical protein BCR37DRAFT_383334 [Protomyces lactucae-debilis]